MKKYMVLPSNSDLNRGDQALIWKTIDTAEKAGFSGEFYMIANDVRHTKQSQSRGIKVASPILKHPSRKFKKNDNSKYSIKLKIRWGLVAFFDLIISLLILSKVTRKIAVNLLSKNDRETIKTIKECDACFVKGGGFIHSYGKLTESYTIYYSLYHIALAQSLGKPVFIMPNSFGPFKGFAVEKMVKNVLSKCYLVTVRESISSEVLDKINVKHSIFPDLGFFLEKENRNANAITKLREEREGYKLVGITARPYRFPSCENPEEKYEKYINDLVLFSKWLYTNKYLPVFVDHTLSNNTHESDRAAIDKVCQNLDEENYAIISNDSYNCKDLKEIYSMFDYVIGTRFHSVIFSLSEKIPSIAVTYGGNKGQGIMQDIGLEEFAIPMNEFDYKKIKSMFEILVENNCEIRKKLNIINQDLEIKYSKLVANIKEKN